MWVSLIAETNFQTWFRAFFLKASFFHFIQLGWLAQISFFLCFGSPFQSSRQKSNIAFTLKTISYFGGTANIFVDCVLKK